MKPSRLQGFTLIELMVAMLITGIIVVGVYGFATGISSNFARENDAAQNSLNTTIAEQLIQRDLQRMGFRASLDSANDPLVRVATGQNFTALKLTKIAASGVVPAHHRVRIVADLSDYDSFVVSNLSGSTLSLEQTLNLPPDPASLQSGTFVRTPASAEAFKAAFRKAFGGSHALRLSSPAGPSVIVGLDSINFDAMTLNISGYSYNTADGFENSTLSQAQVNPITGVQYDLAAKDGEPALRRCTYNPILSNPTLDCVFILERVRYLGFLPISREQSNAQINALLVNGADDLIDEWASASATMSLADLSSVFYRFSLASPKVQRNITVTQAALDARVAAPYYLDGSNHVYILNHVQGSAIVYSQIDDSANSTPVWQL